MISLRSHSSLPTINHRGVKSHFHFVPAGSGLGPTSALGPLIAWNDDEVEPVSGFPTHPHRNVDIVTYVLKGAIVHEDNLGNKGRAGPGEVQAMSAGSGIKHSERNDESVPVKLFQIWFTPRNPGGVARWGMAKLQQDAQGKGFVALASGDPEDHGAVQINTDARVMAARLAPGETLVHSMPTGNSGYLVPTNGLITVNGVDVAALDGCLIQDEPFLTIRANTATEIVFVEIY